MEIVQEFPQRLLRPGERFRWLFGKLAPVPTVHYGVVLRVGHDRFSKDYRVLKDGDEKDEWYEMCYCWPDTRVSCIALYI